MGRAGHAIRAAVVVAMTPVASAEIADTTYAATDSDVVTRFFHRSSLLPDGAVMVSGGMTIQALSLQSLATLSFYDPQTELFSTSFQPGGGGAPVTPVLLTGRSSHTQTTLLDGRVLITGGDVGASGASTGSPTDLVELFDPATGAVSAGPAMDRTRSGHTATRLPDGRVVVAGGAAWQLYDPAADQWSADVALQRSRRNHAAVLLVDHAGPGAHRVLLAGGAGTGPVTLELIDPAGPSSALLTSELAVGVDDLAAALLDDGRVLIVGGQDLATGDTVALTYLLDPVDDMLLAAPTPPGLPNGVADHELVARGRYAILLGGEQQVAGNDTELDAAALFDRVASDWVIADTMTFVHDDFTAAPLEDGRILIVGGGVPFLGQTFPSSSAELLSTAAATPADLDCSGAVDILDLLQLLSLWGPCPPPCPPACNADVDDDCAVGVTDLLAMLAAWG